MKKLLSTTFAVLAIAGATFAQNVPSYVPTNGLVGWWPFARNANDISGNNNNSTVSGATLASDRYGDMNSAYNFDGSSSYIEVAHNNSFNLSDSMTFAFWINTNDVNTKQSVINKASPGVSNSWIVQLSPTPNSQKKIWLNCGGLPLISQLSNASITLNGTWYHVVATYDRVNVKFYINGSLDNTFSLSSPTPANTNGIRIGGLPGEIVNGKLDDIGIWNRALNQSEITALYQACIDSITTQPLDTSGAKGSNRSFSATMSGVGNNFQWQSNSAGLGWQNVPNTNPYSNANTNSLSVNGLTVSNHNQTFRVIASKTGCADTSNVVTLTISDIANDSINLVTLKADTTTKGNRIRQLELDLANKHDTLYINSLITSDTLKVYVNTGTGINSPTVHVIKVYPNPAGSVLNLQLDKPGYYIAELTGVTGQTIVTPTTGIIDISTLANGVYTLRLFDAQNKQVAVHQVAIVK